MNNIFGYGVGSGMMGGWGPWLPILLLWALFWKGLAMWHASKRNQPWWFVILLVVNTAGILEIIYLFLVLKMKAQDLFKKE